MLSLSKGGGAIRGIGEKLSANPVTGTAGLSIPIATSPGRSGFGPALSLTYDSGGGNGPFGFGWSLTVPAITRKTDKGLPRYRDAEESDVYILSGSEDLVPVLNADGTRFTDRASSPGYTIHRYRPRVEGLFARIERLTSDATGEIHWRATTRDNVTNIYGSDNQSRIFDPADPDSAHPTTIFSWRLCTSYDDKGNAAVYEYAAEDDRQVDRAQANERNRTRTANRYLKRIKYGNRVSRLEQPDLTLAEWMFEVVLDYDEGHHADVALDPDRPTAEQHSLVRASAAAARPWVVRPDPFSSHVAGFEVRTYRRCRRVLMFHRFAELGAEPYLVRSTELDYGDLDYTGPVTIDAELAHAGSTRVASFITAITQSGYVRDDGQPAIDLGGVRYLTYRKRSLPRLELAYSQAIIHDDVRSLDAASLENLPGGLDGTAYRWVDLDGEGVSGILTEQAGAWFYKRNLGDGRFAGIETIARAPAAGAPRGAGQQLVDLAGDGQLDLVSFAGPTPGFYERTDDQDWEGFRTFRQLPNIRWDEPNLRFVDLDGDGRGDLLITEQDVLTWHSSLLEEGFGPAQRVPLPRDEERGPRLLLADGTQSVFLADMSGDGLTDLVRVRNGEICYWPNLGYGRFGAKVTMDGAPLFDRADQFDQRRVRLADIDGSGSTDIVYLGRDGVHLYFNQSGNRWSGARRLPQFPPIDNLAQVTIADLLGNGTACLAWSSPLPASARGPLRYIDLMGGQKPHLLISAINNLGAETHLSYAASTKFYLADRQDGRPWITRIPFPVQVVERLSTFDRVSRSRFTTRYAYHHGHFDGVEREFCGFGMVEQWDTEELAALGASDGFPDADNVDAASYVPPVWTKSWFHTGVYLGRNHVSDFFAGLLDARDTGEYYREPGLTDAEARDLLLEDTILPPDLGIGEEAEACRVLKGSLLRREVYALDGSAREPHPYNVTEQSFAIRTVQRRGDNRHAVFLTHARETLTLSYERTLAPVLGGQIVDEATAPANPATQRRPDPRLAHLLTLEVDDFGNILASASVAYGRRYTDGTPDLALAADRDRQTTTLVTCVESGFTNAVDGAGGYRAPLSSETRTFELTGLTRPPGQARFAFDDVRAAATGAAVLAYEGAPTAGVLQKRLIAHARTLYRADDLTGPLALGRLQPLALPFQACQLALTPGLVASVYGARVTDAIFENEGGYVHSQGDSSWWIPSGRLFYSPGAADTAAAELAYARQHFFLPLRYRDPFHAPAISTESFATYDRYDLLLQETRDAADNRVTAGERNVDPTMPLVRSGQDYRVLKAALVMDPNRNRRALAFDALGMVAGTAAMGKPEETPALGDQIAPAFHADLTRAEIDAFFANPKGSAAAALLGDATTRIISDPDAYARAADPALAPPVYTATLARTSHASDPTPAGGLRIQCSFDFSDGFGREIQKKIEAEPGPTSGGGGNANPRWVGTGWTVFNNKGKPVRRFEPFFTDRHRFERDVRVGVSAVIFYDPLERVVATLNPNRTWEKVVFDPWRQESWDVTDTVLTVDPSTDPDVGTFIARLPAAAYLPTWYTERQGGALGPQEQAAAEKTILCADTPAVSHADVLGRTFLTIAHNRTKYSDAPAADPPIEERQGTRLLLDIEGNQRAVTDALDRTVVTYTYGLGGNRIQHFSMDAGQRLVLNDVTGKPLYGWDSRDHRLRSTYDPLRRPTGSFLRDGAAATTEVLVERQVYGESRPLPEARNLRGRRVQHFDQAGVVTSDDYDFKGNALGSQRQLAQSYKTTLDWSGAVPLEAPVYASTKAYDALDRPTELAAPDRSLIRLGYNQAGLLEQIDANLRGEQQGGAPVFTPFVTGIDYDAKGRRASIDYGNGVRTTYEYDPLTFRLVGVVTRRGAAAFPGDCPRPPPPGWPGCQVQNLRYVYDPAGNVTHLTDSAQQAIYFRNQRVDASNEHTYDALGRLVEATGREHLGQVGGSPIPHSYDDAGRVGLLHPNDGNAVGRYLERYVYDATGNVISFQHRGSDPANPGWTRTFSYEEASLIEAARHSNRLTRTTVGATNESYSNAGDGYDAHGNMLRMPQLEALQWDFRDLLQMTRRQAVNATDADGTLHAGERTYYVYDAGGQRVRKVTELAGGVLKDQRIYLGGFEIFLRAGADPLTRETLHIMDDQQRVALCETRTAGNEPGIPARLVRFQIGNHLGSSSLELDDGAQVISYEEYTPYGSTSYQGVRSQTEAPKRYRYIGKERDDETGLGYHGARYFAPWLARWTSADPLGIKDGPNVYLYSRDNPVRLSDPGGTECSERDVSGCPQGTAPPPPQTNGTLLPSADANGGGPPRDPPPVDPPGRGRSTLQLAGDWTNAIGDSSRQFQLRGGLLSPGDRAASYPVVGTAQIGTSLGRAFKLVWNEHPQLRADTTQLGLSLWREHTPEILVAGGASLLATGIAAGAGHQWWPASQVSSLLTLIPEQTISLAQRPSSPGDLYFRQLAFQLRDSAAIGRNEGSNPLAIFPTLQLRGQFLDRDLTLTAGLNARYLPDLQQVRLQESLALDRSIARFDIGPYRASLNLEGRANFYQQIDLTPSARSTPLPAEGTFSIQFRITDPPTRRTTPTLRDGGP